MTGIELWASGSEATALLSELHFQPLALVPTYTQNNRFSCLLRYLHTGDQNVVLL